MKQKRQENEPSCPPGGVVEWSATVIQKNARGVRVGKQRRVQAQTWHKARELAVVELGVAPDDLDVRQVTS